MPSFLFHPKFGAAGFGGSLSIVILWGLSYAVKIPAPVQGAIEAIVLMVCVWAAPFLPAEKPAPPSQP